MNFKGGLLQATLGSPGAWKLIPEAPWESKSTEDRFWEIMSICLARERKGKIEKKKKRKKP